MSEAGSQSAVERVTGTQYRDVWTKDPHGGPYRKARSFESPNRRVASAALSAVRSLCERERRGQV